MFFIGRGGMSYEEGMPLKDILWGAGVIIAGMTTLAAVLSLALWTCGASFKESTYFFWMFASRFGTGGALFWIFATVITSIPGWIEEWKRSKKS